MRRRIPFAATKIDVVPNLYAPAIAFMLASATKMAVVFAGAVALALFMNWPMIFRDDPFWKKKHRVFLACLAIPVCIWLFFAIDDLRTQDLTILITTLIYGVIVLVVEYGFCRE